MLISDTEAGQVWERAASLQASTEVRSRPAPLEIVRDARRDQSRTSGIKVGDVVEAGREAGIGTGYLERVLVERGLSASAAGLRDPVRVKASLWAGVPLDIIERAEVPGEIAPSHFDRMLNLLRDGTRTVGSVTANTRELGWNTEWTGHRLHASIASLNGKTTVRLAQSIRRMAVGVFASSAFLGATFGLLTAAVSDRLIGRTPTPHWIRSFGFNLYVHRDAGTMIAIALGAGVALSSIPIARALIRASWRSNAARLRLLSEALSANIRIATRDD
jgi:hypothetical protein